jgi:hypothetical protein
MAVIHGSGGFSGFPGERQSADGALATLGGERLGYPFTSRAIFSSSQIGKVPAWIGHVSFME